jgi:RNA-directed DNA polymerase
VQRLKTKVGDLLAPGNNDPWPDVRDALNGLLFGWSRYFSYGTHRAVSRGIDSYVYERVRDFLARRHKVPRRSTRRFSYDVLYGERGVLPLERTPRLVTPCASR